MSFSILPVEIAQAILFELRDTRPAAAVTQTTSWKDHVASFSLVARAWRWLAQQVLFDDLRVRLKDRHGMCIYCDSIVTPR